FSTERNLARRALAARNSSTAREIRTIRFRTLGVGGSDARLSRAPGQHTGRLAPGWRSEQRIIPQKPGIGSLPAIKPGTGMTALTPRAQRRDGQGAQAEAELAERAAAVRRNETELE